MERKSMIKEIKGGFTERLQLAKEYIAWLKKEGNEARAILSGDPYTMIVFLETLGWRQVGDDEVVLSKEKYAEYETYKKAVKELFSERNAIYFTSGTKSAEQVKKDYLDNEKGFFGREELPAAPKIGDMMYGLTTFQVEPFYGKVIKIHYEKEFSTIDLIDENGMVVVFDGTEVFRTKEEAEAEYLKRLKAARGEEWQKQ